MNEMNFEYQHSQPTFDRIEAQERVVEQLQGIAWKIIPDSERDSIPESWAEWPLDNGTVVVIDPQKINIGYVSKEYPDDKLAGWKKLGTIHKGTSEVIIRPQNKELDFKKFDGVTFFTETDGGDYFMVGTLKVSLLSPDLSTEDLKIIGSKSTCAEIIIERVNREGQTGDMHARNPSLAKTSLPSDLSIVLNQLKAMGYTTITCYPTDERRARVYQKMGFLPLPSPGEFYMRLN